jgi:hypothetical protein
MGGSDDISYYDYCYQVSSIKVKAASVLATSTYEQMKVGNCGTSNSKIITQSDCDKAAEALVLSSTKSQASSGYTYPFGCYYKKSSMKLYFNPTGNMASTDVDRVAICWKGVGAGGQSASSGGSTDTSSGSSKLKNLVNLGAKPSSTLNECEGDCDTDSDCASGLLCFQRDMSSSQVPGCQIGGTGDVGYYDYCYIKANVASSSSSSSSSSSGTNTECGQGYTCMDGDIAGDGDVNGVGNQQPVPTCNACATLCDNDNDCDSYECSPTTLKCNLNDQALPTGGPNGDFIFCSKGGMGTSCASLGIGAQASAASTAVLTKQCDSRYASPDTAICPGERPTKTCKMVVAKWICPANKDQAAKSCSFSGTEEATDTSKILLDVCATQSNNAICNANPTTNTKNKASFAIQIAPGECNKLYYEIKTPIICNSVFTAMNEVGVTACDANHATACADRQITWIKAYCSQQDKKTGMFGDSGTNKQGAGGSNDPCKINPQFCSGGVVTASYGVAAVAIFAIATVLLGAY